MHDKIRQIAVQVAEQITALEIELQSALDRIQAEK